MRNVSTDSLWAGISGEVKKRNSSLLSDRREYRDAAKKKADKVRERIEAQKRRKQECDSGLRLQRSLIDGCKTRRSTHPARLEKAKRLYAEAESNLRTATENESIWQQKVARNEERYDALTFATPMVTSNYEAELAAYNARLSAIDEEIDRLEKEANKFANESSDSPELLELIKANHVQANKLRGDKASIARPVEDVGQKQARERHLQKIEDVKAELAKAEREERTWRENVAGAQESLGLLKQELEDLREEPNRDLSTERHANEELLRLEKLRASISTEPSREEQKLLDIEAQAIASLKAAEKQVAHQIEAAKANFKEASIAGDGGWDQFSLLTSKRKDAEALWNGSVKEELEYIQQKEVPELREAEEELLIAEEKFGFADGWEPSEEDELSAEEEKVLQTTFTHEEMVLLRNGGVLVKKRYPEAIERLFYSFFGVIGWATSLAIVEGVFPGASDQDGVAVLLLVWLVLLIFVPQILIPRMLKQKIYMKTCEDTGAQMVDIPYTRGYEIFDRAQRKIYNRQRSSYAKSALDSARLKESVARQKLESLAEDRFPESMRTVPLDSSDRVKNQVDVWFMQTVNASLGDGSWPRIDIDTLRARRPKVTNEHLDRVYSRWKKELEDNNLEEFVV